MNLPKESIEEFRDIYEAEYGQRLSFEEAKKRAVGLLDFCLFVMETGKKIEDRERKRRIQESLGQAGTGKEF
jgi:hypothetical protein